MSSGFTSTVKNTWPTLPFLVVSVRGVSVGIVLGLYCSSAVALSTADFTNTGITLATPGQYENNTANNSSSILIQPKGMSVKKTADASQLSNPTVVGEVVQYSIEVENLGLLGLSNIQVTDSIIPALDLSLISGDLNSNVVLDASETWLFSGSYAVTQADLDSNGGGDGDIDNVVSVSADQLSPVQDNAEVAIFQAPSFTVSKTVDQAALAEPGALNYSIEIQNTGNLTLTGINPVDTLPDGQLATLVGPINDNGIAGSLDVGETWQFTTSFNATQQDIDAALNLVNTVVVSSIETGAISQSDNAETVINSAPELTIEKQVDQSSIDQPGILNYEITLTNSGNATLTEVVLTDTQPNGSAGAIGLPVADIGVVEALDVGESWVYRLSYNVSQAEIDAGTVLSNTASVTSLQTGSSVYTSQVDTTIVREPSISVDKTVDLLNLASPGTLEYVISLNNTGNVSLSGVSVNDILPDGAEGVLPSPSGDAGLADVLDVGENWEYSISYEATQADIDAAVDLVNNVSVTSLETGSETISDSASTAIVVAAQLVVEKTVDQATINSPELLAYEIAVSNAGNVTLNNPVIEDTLPDGSIATLIGPVSDTGLAGALDVGETWVFSAAYQVTQAEIDAGTTLTNAVTVSSDETGVASVTDTAVTTISRTPQYVLSKAVDAASVISPGVLNYSITAENIGNVSLSNINIEDTLPDGSTAQLSSPLGDSGVPGVLDVGETWLWTGSYSVTQADLDEGAPLVNSVTLTTTEAGSASASATTNVSQQPKISITKGVAQTQFTKAGDVLEYTLVISNSGNVVLSGVSIVDAGLDGNALNCTPVVPELFLPGSELRCSGVHTVSDADVQATLVDNQAAVSAIDSQGLRLEASSELVSVAMQRIPPVASEDVFVAPQSAMAATLSGATDDSDANGDLLVNTLSLIHTAAIDVDGDGDFDTLVVESEGSWVVDDATGTVLFTPRAGFTIDPSPVLYTISDATGLLSNQALLIVDYPQTAPVAYDDLVVNANTASPANATIVNVLADNGSGVDTDPENDINLQSVALVHTDAVDTDGDGDADMLEIAGQGIWFVDNNNATVTFTPQEGFLADPTPVSYTISDTTGLSSNVALITVDYPQNAPVAIDDQMVNVRLGEAATVSTLANDTDIEFNIDPTTVRILNALNSEMSQTVFVPDQGTWSVDAATGDISFTPQPGFHQNPAPIQYSVFDTTSLESNLATVTVLYQKPVTLAGTVWLDADRDGLVGDDEERKALWTLHIFDDAGNLVATTVTDAMGNYSVTGLIPGSFRVDFYNETGVFMDSQSTIDPLVSGQTLNLPLPVDPSGVVYDSISRESVAGVTLIMRNSSGDAIDAACLSPKQQGQLTQDDGLYAFDIVPGAHPSCSSNEIYVIELAGVPDGYHPYFSTVIPYVGAESCGDETLGCAISRTFDADSAEGNCTIDSLPLTSACEIQSQATPPQANDDTRYYIEFELAAGDRNVIFNHLPIDAKVNDAEVLLSKVADRRTVSVGSLVKYTLTAENTKEVPAFGVAIVDKPPAGFVFVEESVQLIRTGEDGELNTSDDVVVALTSSGNNLVNFDTIDLQPLEVARISYVLRVATGVVPGNYVNAANAIGPNGVASNDVTATVTVVPDPVLEQATLIGKVFDDVDADGTQDNASVSALLLGSDYYGWNSLALGELSARSSTADNPQQHAIVVNMPLTDTNHFEISTREGTRLSVDEQGTVTEAHVGARASGLNSQDIRVCTRRATALPTPRTGMPYSQAEIDVLEIVLTNHGVSERGIPGVRLATVTGLLVETDAYGRFSIPDVSTGRSGLGQNMVLKVDSATLPEGARFTTENPYVLRILNTGLNRINFGVQTQRLHSVDSYAASSLPCATMQEAGSETVLVNLGSVFFDTDEHTVRDDQAGIVDDIVSKLQEYGGGDIVIEAHADSRGSADYNLALAERRANVIRDILRSSLSAQLMENINVDVEPALKSVRGSDPGSGPSPSTSQEATQDALSDTDRKTSGETGR